MLKCTFHWPIDFSLFQESVHNLPLQSEFGCFINASPPMGRTYASVNRVSIGSVIGSSPIRRQAIIWTTAGLLSIGSPGTSFSDIIIESQTFSFKKIQLKMSAKCRPVCLGLNVLISYLLLKMKWSWPPSASSSMGTLKDAHVDHRLSTAKFCHELRAYCASIQVVRKNRTGGDIQTVSSSADYSSVDTPYVRESLLRLYDVLLMHAVILIACYVFFQLGELVVKVDVHKWCKWQVCGLRRRRWT